MKMALGVTEFDAIATRVMLPSAPFTHPCASMNCVWVLRWVEKDFLWMLMLAPLLQVQLWWLLKNLN